MSDEMLPTEGFDELWGHAIFQWPYCRRWEVKDRPCGYIARAGKAPNLLPFALQLRGWTRELVVFTGGDFAIAEEARLQLQAAGVRLETLPVARLVA